MACEPKTRPVCGSCGSGDVVVDAFARWDSDAQDWDLTAAYPETAICEECGLNAPLRWINIEEAT